MRIIHEQTKVPVHLCGCLRDPQRLTGGWGGLWRSVCPVGSVTGAGGEGEQVSTECPLAVTVGWLLHQRSPFCHLKLNAAAPLEAAAGAVGKRVRRSPLCVAQQPVSLERPASSTRQGPRSVLQHAGLQPPPRVLPGKLWGAASLIRDRKRRG